MQLTQPTVVIIACHRAGKRGLTRRGLFCGFVVAVLTYFYLWRRRMPSTSKFFDEDSHSDLQKFASRKRKTYRSDSGGPLQRQQSSGASKRREDSLSRSFRTVVVRGGVPHNATGYNTSPLAQSRVRLGKPSSWLHPLARAVRSIEVSQKFNGRRRIVVLE